MMIDPVVRYIVTQHPGFIPIYVFEDLRKRDINVKRIIEKLNELYGEHYNGEQFLFFGEKYLNDYLIEKHGLTFYELLLESFQPIIPRFRNLGH